MKTVFNILLLGSLILLTSCGDVFDYSSYVIDFQGENKGVNLTNIEKLSNKNSL